MAGPELIVSLDILVRVFMVPCHASLLLLSSILLRGAAVVRRLRLSGETNTTTPSVEKLAQHTDSIQQIAL